MVQWEKQYETGIKSIDKQHKHLIKLASELDQMLVNSVHGEDVYDQLMEIIEQLAEYTSFHLKYEEDLFAKYHYEFAQNHINEHNKLLQEIGDLDFMSVDVDTVAQGKKGLKLLTDSVLKHISGSDFMYVDLLKQNNVK